MEASKTAVAQFCLGSLAFSILMCEKKGDNPVPFRKRGLKNAFSGSKWGSLIIFPLKT